MRTDCHCGASHHQEHCSSCLGKAYATITVCAWCGYELDAWNRPTIKHGNIDHYLNHGICTKCHNRISREAGLA